MGTTVFYMTILSTEERYQLSLNDACGKSIKFGNFDGQYK